MTGIDVSEPCPISVAGDMMKIVPSLESVTHAFIAICRESRVAAAFADGIHCGGAAAMQNVRPAAPCMKRRRPIAMRAALLGFIESMAHASFDARSIARAMRT